MFIYLTSGIELLDIGKYLNKVIGYIYKTYTGFLGVENIHWLVDYGTLNSMPPIHNQGARIYQSQRSWRRDCQTMRKDY